MTFPQRHAVSRTEVTSTSTGPLRPRVSIGMPVHNGGPYISMAIEALLTQEYRDFELIISDNASTDSTEEICRSYAAADPRVRYQRHRENVGAAANHNQVIRVARGEFFKLASDDDVCRPAFLQRCVEAFDSLPPEVVLVYPRALFIDENGAVLREDTDRLETRADAPFRRLAHLVANVNMVNALHGAIRMDALRQTRLMGSFFGADYVLLAELALLGQFHEIPDYLFLRRQHPGSSQEANRTVADVLAWWDPQVPRGRLLMPRRERLLLEYARSVRSMPLSAPQKAACLAAIGTVHYTRRLRVAAGRHRRRVGTALNRGAHEEPGPPVQHASG